MSRDRAIRVGLWLGVMLSVMAVAVFVPLALGGLGKLGFFLTTVAYWLAGDLSGTMVGNAIPDLVLGAGFVLWAATERPSRATPPVVNKEANHE